MRGGDGGGEGGDGGDGGGSAASNPIAAAPSCNEMALHGQLAAAKQKHVACYYKIEAKGAGKRGLWNFDFSKQLVWMGIPCKGISESSSYSA